MKMAIRLSEFTPIPVLYESGGAAFPDKADAEGMCNRINSLWASFPAWTVEEIKWNEKSYWMIVWDGAEGCHQVQSNRGAGWFGEGEEGKERLAKTRGTVWVVFLSRFQLSFYAFENRVDAERCWIRQLEIIPTDATRPVRFFDGQPAGTAD